MIALMLVPLNFLAMASFAEASELTYASIAGEFVTLGIFLVLGYYASRILTPKFPWLTDLLVVGLAFSNLLIRRFIFSDPPGKRSTPSLCRWWPFIRQAYGLWLVQTWTKVQMIAKRSKSLRIRFGSCWVWCLSLLP